MFFDEARIRVRAGNGGNGCVAFRREWGVPRGGPSGGNGGKGGDVYVRAAARLNTLLAFEHQNLFVAERGQHGRGKNLTGRTGKDEIVEVPLGTVVRDADSGQLLGDLVRDGQQVCVAHGGRGGRGNAAFTTSTNQAPRISERGEPGEERRPIDAHAHLHQLRRDPLLLDRPEPDDLAARLRRRQQSLQASAQQDDRTV